MKVYVLDNGYLECDSNQMVAMDTCATVDDKAPVHKWIKIPVYSVLIDHPQAKILFDTGCHPDAMKGRWPKGLTSVFPHFATEDQQLVNQLKKAGFAPKDIDIIVQSHMHLDHAGNLELFTHADVYVHKADFEFGLRLVHQNPDPATHGAYVKADLEVPCKFHMVEEDFELVPGVEVITLPGHTPGVLGVMVHLDQSGTLIFPMDAVYQSGNLGPPARLSGIVYDSISFLASIEKVRKLAKKYNAQVMFSHDIDFFATMKKAPEFYE
ncbi:N-acyl homoserine lactonase family protein [Desulfotomaculum nigrificans]|uniref:N-acyl homoserine lactonase family protein n=1 Tax=Desulfotomaculum nigrificans TaxID=1565 RepID=UPI0001FAE807|nr:N-acyl homoserine lactonase family protein [Desulfotomaculum nigrificans]